MRPRVHRHLAGQVRELASDLASLPIIADDPEYEEARTLMRDRLNGAMKYEMRASTFLRRGDRSSAADAWWGFRREVRSARTIFQCARVFAKIGHSIEI